MRPVRLGNPDYTLNADARHSRTMAGMVSESRGVGLGISGVSRLENGVIRPKGRVEDDGIFAMGDGEEHELENMSPRKRVTPRAAWPEMPSHPSETRATHRRNSLSTFSFRFRRDSTKTMHLRSA